MAAIARIGSWGIFHSKKGLGFTRLLNVDNYLNLHRRLYGLRNNGKKLKTSESRFLHFVVNGRESWKSCISLQLEKACSGECWSILSKHQINTSASFDAICEETLESLANHFEDLIGNHLNVADTDVTLSDGVLTVNLGANNGIYVINKQGPNQQIWLSSPTSGPKRYDFIGNQWIYRRDGNSLHQLLTKEITEALHTDVDFTECTYGK